MKPFAMAAMVLVVGSIGAQRPAGVETAPCERACTLQEFGAGVEQSFDLLERLLATNAPDLPSV